MNVELCVGVAYAYICIASLKTVIFDSDYMAYQCQNSSVGNTKYEIDMTSENFSIVFPFSLFMRIQDLSQNLSPDRHLKCHKFVSPVR